MVMRDGELKRTVLCFVFDPKENALLMIFKKRGQGSGKMNVPGGKIKNGESADSAAVRETIEETGIEPLGIREAGKLEFTFPESDAWDNTCTVFECHSFRGTLIPESDECRALWVPRHNIPIDKMWDADRLWLPHLLAGKPFHRSYVFDRNEMVKEERVIK
jgi:8-oxo-dGTP diphosphatase